MNALRCLLVLATALTLAPAASAQTLGRMLYSNRVGRAISLNVVEAGHPTLMSLQPETGDAEKFRNFLLAHAGQEGVAAKEAHLVPEKAPQGWRVKINRHDALLQTPEITFWRYTSGWVVPVRFKLLGQDWQLISADLPARMFVPSPGKGR
ncbi:MAG: hypothetical protein IPN59_15285 [Holophaga sp.]|nr:hypothetical protein [Holophaga sp.]